MAVEIGEYEEMSEVNQIEHNKNGSYIRQLTVDEIIDTTTKERYTFEIPRYQRGYRWGEREVTDLLDDINETFDARGGWEDIKDNCQTHSYCLQPISLDMSKINERIMVVVDGQQRLTTLYLILKLIEKELNNVDDEFLKQYEIQEFKGISKNFSIRYEDETRNNVFTRIINSLDNNVDGNISINEDNIDAYYITKACQTIKHWCDKTLRGNALRFATFAGKTLYSTSLIWYEINQATDGTTNNYFAKINTGRIPLTNSELIKANLMLDEYCGGKIDTNGKNPQITDSISKNLANERIKISRQWDTIENSLRNDEFWYFLTQKSDKYEDTRIDFIFEIVAERLYVEVPLDNLEYKDFINLNKERGSFTIIERYLKKHRNDVEIGQKVWKMAWDTYMIFREWFDDRQLYHYIGYLISVGRKDAKKLIEECSKKEIKTKDEIRRKLKDEIMKQSSLYSDNGNKKIRSLEGYKDYLAGLDYDKSDDNKKLSDILLLFNVISIVSDCNGKDCSSRDTYFPFSRFKKEKWNLEHVHSKADGEFVSKNAADEYMAYLAKIVEQMKGQGVKGSDYDVISNAVKMYEKEIKRQSKQGSNNEKEVLAVAKTSVCSIGEKYNDLSPEKLNGIGNLALLDESTNKSYGNVPFFMKRMIIRDIVSGKDSDVSKFIPFCTRNVFDKAYTKYPKNMLHWTDEDYDGYFNTIAETIWNYLDKDR